MLSRLTIYFNSNSNKDILLVSFLIISGYVLRAQNTVTSGNWTDPTVWSGVAIPTATGTVNASNPITIDQNITITTGTYNFGYNGTSAVSTNVTDPPGGTAYTLTALTSGGSLIVWAGTTTFEGAASFDNCTLWVKSGATLIVGAMDINNGTTVTIDGTLIINGDFANNNNGTGTMVVSGACVVHGNYSAPVGSVNISGAGTFNTTGTIATTGSSDVFGFTNDCTAGPCSDTNLTCTFTNTISPISKAVCSGTSPGTLTATTSGSSPAYQWKNSTDGITFANISGATSSTFAAPTLTQATWYRVQVTASSCTNTSAAIKVTVLPATGGWQGGTSTSWGTAGNWCGSSLPTNTVDVVISNASGITNMPSVLSGTSAVCKSLTVDNTFPATSLTIANAANASLSVSGDFTNNGTFTDNSSAAAGGVSFVGGVAQTITGSTANVFSNLTINNTSGATPAVTIATNNVKVNSNLTMTSGIINLNGYTITLGTAAASAGTLSYTAGKFYGGNIERWFPTSAVTVGTAASLFPIGTSTAYRPIYFGSSGLTASGGTIKARHTSVTGASNASFSDSGTPIQVTSNSFWTVSTANGISSTGTPISIRTEGTGLGTVGVVSDLRLTLLASAVGTAGTNAGTSSIPQVNRTALTVANLINTFYWGSINKTQTPLPVTLASFHGHQAGEQINLNWKTESEINFHYFSVEKSLDGKTFFEVGKVEGYHSAKKENFYSWEDKIPTINKNYYRLRLLDFDGSFEYSHVIVIDYLHEKDFSISPNPTTGKFIGPKINFKTEEQSLIVIYDSVGNGIGTYQFSGNETGIGFSNPLTPGFYFAKFCSPTFTKIVRFLVHDK